MKRHVLPSFILLSSIAFADDVSFLTATSTDRQIVVEFMNPPAGGYELTRVIGRRDRFALDGDDFGPPPLFVVDIVGDPGQKSFAVQTGLTNDQTYFYSVFVFDGTNWSSGVNIEASPVDTVNTPIRWRFVTRAGAVTMNPPGLGSVLLVLSNDRTLYPIERGSGPTAGRWAAGALPATLTDVGYHRPPVIPPTGPFADTSVTLVSTQDGIVHCFDAETGAFLWDSQDFGMLTGAPAGWFSVFSGGPDDLVYIGTRNTGVPNQFHALHLSDGSPAWPSPFDNAPGPGIGIISGSAAIDYQRQAAYVASVEFSAGADTVFAVDLADGQKIWSTPVGNVSGSPVQRGLDLFVGNDAGLVYALDVRDGTVKPNFPFDTETGSPIKGFLFPSFTGPEVFLSSEDSVIRIRDTGTNVVQDWATSVPGASIPTHPPGRLHVYAGSSDGGLYQLDAATGVKMRLPITSGGTPGVGNPTYDIPLELIYAGTENGEVLAVQAPY